MLGLGSVPTLAGPGDDPAPQGEPGYEFWFDLSSAVLLVEANDGFAKLYSASMHVSVFGFGSSGIPGATVSDVATCAVSSDPSSPEPTDVCITPGPLLGNYVESTGPCDLIDATSYCAATMCLEVDLGNGPTRTRLPVVVGGNPFLPVGPCGPL